VEIQSASLKFCQFGFKMPTDTPFMGFGGFDPLNVDQHQHSPQKAGSHAETHHITYIGPSVWVHQKSKTKVITGSNALSKLLKGRF